MALLILNVPDDVESKLNGRGECASEVMRLAAAFSLCQRGELSTSQASRLAGMSYVRFLESAVRAKVALFSVDLDELNEEINCGFTMGRQRLADHIAGQGGAD